MARIPAIAQKHDVPVVEDACQAHLGQWRNRGLGSWGTTGCYSFQASKNLCAGEGGAVLTNDEPTANKCYAFHNNCRKRDKATYDFTYKGGRSTNARMTEFQGALLLSQWPKLKQRARTRSENAAYLTKMLDEIPGTIPQRMYEGCTRASYYHYSFRFQPEEFSGLSRNQFVRALRKEGIPSGTGYHPLNQADFIRDALGSRPYVRVYGKEAIEKWPQRNACPQNDKLCNEAVWLSQKLLLGPRSDMDDIVTAIRKIKAHAPALARAERRG